jgi:type III pantothenate kinase
LTDDSTGPVLTLDRGNSTLDCMVWGERPRRTRLDPQDMDGLRRFLGADRPLRVVGVTVVEGGLEPVRETLQEYGARLLLAGPELPVPLRVAYPDPGTLGADRLVGALAAHVRHGAAVVVDCGTALTVNLVQDGAFLGGAIAPGPTAMARGLAAGAPALPVVDLSAEVRLPATSSADAVNAGVRLGFCALLDGLVAAVAAAGNLTAAPHLLTGGQAQLYLDSCREAGQKAGPHVGGEGEAGNLDFEHVPDLVHQGLRWLATDAWPC